MKLRKKKSPETRMKYSFFIKCVWLIQLLPRRCAPQPSGPWPPARFYTFYVWGFEAGSPPPPCPSMREHYPTKQKSGLRAAFLLLRKLFYSGYIGLISPALTWASLYAALFLAPAKYSCGIGLLSGPLLWPSIRQLG